MTDTDIEAILGPAPADDAIVVGIDPSIKKLGWSIFINKKLICYGTIIADEEDNKMSIENRVQLSVARLANILPSSKYKQIWVVEEPAMFSSSTSLAATFNNSLKKLLLTVGAIIWHGFLIKANIRMAPVAAWKGNLPKEVTTRDMERKYGVKFKHHDEADAVGLADWFIGGCK